MCVAGGWQSCSHCALGREQALAQEGSIEAGRTKSVTCAACHGADGNSVSPDWPSLAGQHASYIVRQLQAFKSGERQDVTMTVFAMMLSDQDMLDLAAYFASADATPKGADPALVSLGQQIYRGGVPERGIAACIACHGPGGRGNPLAAYPSISNQQAAYVTKTLTPTRPETGAPTRDFNQMMRNVADLLLENEIRGAGELRARTSLTRRLRGGFAMLMRHTWIFAALAVAGCGGGSPEPEQARTAAEQAAAQGSQVGGHTERGGADARRRGATVFAGRRRGATVVGCRRAQHSGDSPTSTRFQLGTHYTRLSPTQPTSSSPDQVEVTEIFWYGCPHCYTFDPYLASWQGRKADYVNFVRVPAVWNEAVRLHARAFYTAEALGKGAEMHEALFREIHVNQNPLDTEAKLQEFFGKFGVDAADFKSAFDSFAVHTKLQRADELSRRYQVASVPTIVVNGKYMTDGGMAGGYDELIELVDELAASERNGR